MIEAKLDDGYQHLLDNIQDLTPWELKHSVLIFKELEHKTNYYFYGLKTNKSLI